jgi:hypothetical protein
MKRKRARNGDPVVAEIRRIKDRLAARFNYDAESMLRDAQRRQRRAGRKVVSLSKRPIPAPQS